MTIKESSGSGFFSKLNAPSVAFGVIAGSVGLLGLQVAARKIRNLVQTENRINIAWKTKNNDKVVKHELTLSSKGSFPTDCRIVSFATVGNTITTARTLEAEIRIPPTETGGVLKFTTKERVTANHIGQISFTDRNVTATFTETVSQASPGTSIPQQLEAFVP